MQFPRSLCMCWHLGNTYVTVSISGSSYSVLVKKKYCGLPKSWVFFYCISRGICSASRGKSIICNEKCHLMLWTSLVPASTFLTSVEFEVLGYGTYKHPCAVCFQVSQYLWSPKAGQPQARHFGTHESGFCDRTINLPQVRQSQTRDCL